MRLGIDLDDVLANFIPRFRVEAQTLFPDNAALVEEPVDWGWSNWGLSPAEIDAVWTRIANTRHFHEQLDTLPHTDNLTELEIAGHDIYFITARFDTGGLSAKWQTEQWLRTKFGIANPTVLIAKDKAPVIAALQLDAFIDDNAATCMKAYACTNAQVTMMSRRHNSEVVFPDRVDTFNEWAERFVN